MSHAVAHSKSSVLESSSPLQLSEPPRCRCASLPSSRLLVVLPCRAKVREVRARALDVRCLCVYSTRMLERATNSPTETSQQQQQRQAAATQPRVLSPFFRPHSRRLDVARRGAFPRCISPCEHIRFLSCVVSFACASRFTSRCSCMLHDSFASVSVLDLRVRGSRVFGC